MKQSKRKRVSLTKLTLARVKYIREHYFQFAAHQVSKRRDVVNLDCMHQDTAIIEAGIEVLFNAICKTLGLVPEEVDQTAIAEYAMHSIVFDEYVDKLSDFVELECKTEKQKAITPEDRKKAVDEYRNKKNRDISDEWGEQV